MILRPSDGTPFILYRDVAPGNYLNTYETNLEPKPGEIETVFLEPLVGPQNAANMTYAPAFARGALVPDWASAFLNANGYGWIRLDGQDIPGVSSTTPVGPSLVVTPDGARHLLWTDGNVAYHAGPAGVTTLFTTINRSGGETKVASDAAGVLHAVIRGVDGVSADWDLGAVVYITSSDGGQTWSPVEYIDPSDAVPDSIGVNSNISLALDANGVPAVTYWRYNSELWYARRDGPNGTWTRSLVTFGNKLDAPRSAQVRFDANGQPVIALYDMGADKVRLARPVPVGSVPVDLAVSGQVTPTTAQPGALLTYTLTVTNLGSTNVDNVVLSNALPAGATFVDGMPAGSGNSTWNLGTLTSGASTTVTVHATAPVTAGDLIDTATVASDGVEARPGDNSVTLFATVLADRCFVPPSGLVGLWRGDGNTLSGVAGEPTGDVYGEREYQRAAIGDRKSGV